MAMLPIVIGAMFAGTIVFVGGGIMKARGDPIFLGGGTPHHPPKDWRKRDADDRLMRALYIIPQGSANMSHPGWNALSGLVAHRKHPHDSHGEKNALFVNEAKNFSVEGTLTELAAVANHRGVMHGHITVPFGANEEMAQGKYIAVDPEEADAETVDAFDGLERALQDLERSGANAMDFLRLAIE